MLERPDLTDAAMLAGLQAHYGITAGRMEFLPIGYDSHAWVFRADGDDGRAYFVKVRRGPINEPGLIVPHFLQSHGIAEVVAPLATRTRDLWAAVGAFRLILYPFIEGVSGLAAGLTDDQWVEYGAILRRIHGVAPSPELAAQMKHETFVPHLQWSRIARTLQAEIAVRDYTNPHERELAAFWRERRGLIDDILARAAALGQRLQAGLLQRARAFVVCHADIHRGNVLIAADGGLHIVDWDETILAPKERDLIFVVGQRVALPVEPREAALFLRGYGDTAIDALAVNYYRYEWAVQEIGAFGEQVLLQPDAGDATKADAARLLMGLFDPGDLVDLAYRMDSTQW